MRAVIEWCEVLSAGMGIGTAAGLAAASSWEASDSMVVSVRAMPLRSCGPEEVCGEGEDVSGRAYCCAYGAALLETLRAVAWVVAEASGVRAAEPWCLVLDEVEPLVACNGAGDVGSCAETGEPAGSGVGLASLFLSVLGEVASMSSGAADCTSGVWVCSAAGDCGEVAAVDEGAETSGLLLAPWVEG